MKLGLCRLLSEQFELLQGLGRAEAFSSGALYDALVSDCLGGPVTNASGWRRRMLTLAAWCDSSLRCLQGLCKLWQAQLSQSCLISCDTVCTLLLVCVWLAISL